MASRKTDRKKPPSKSTAKTAGRKPSAPRARSAALAAPPAAAPSARGSVGTTKIQCPHGKSIREFCRVPNDARVGSIVLCTPLGHQLSVLTVKPFKLG